MPPCFEIKTVRQFVLSHRAKAKIIEEASVERSKAAAV
jgi:hypothetical protein